jgi:hypothetical protein
MRASVQVKSWPTNTAQHSFRPSTSFTIADTDNRNYVYPIPILNFMDHLRIGAIRKKSISLDLSRQFCNRGLNLSFSSLGPRCGCCQRVKTAYLWTLQIVSLLFPRLIQYLPEKRNKTLLKFSIAVSSSLKYLGDHSAWTQLLCGEES